MRLVHRHRFGRHPDLAWSAPEVLGGVGVHARSFGAEVPQDDAYRRRKWGYGDLGAQPLATTRPMHAGFFETKFPQNDTALTRTSCRCVYD
jgi:hypothetical protein